MSAITRNAMSPAGVSSSRDGSSSDGSGSPVSAQTVANAVSMSATAGPRTSTPVSRQGSVPRSGSPAHIFPTQSPVTKPTRPSTASIFRWSRLTQPKGLSSRGGLKQRTSTPASRNERQNFFDAFRKPPIQS